MSTLKRSPGIAALLLIAFNLFAGEGKIRRSPQPIKDEYLVVLQDSIPEDKVPEVARRVANAHGATPTRIWHSALKGFLVTMPEGRAEALSRHPDVRFVEENAEVFLSGTGTITTNVDPSTCNPWTNPGCATTVDNRIWHLDRLGQTWASPDHRHTSCDDGTGVTVYVLDTGVKADHQEFLRSNGTSRVVTTGYDATQEGPYFPAHDPCNGWPGDRPPTGWLTEQQRYAFAVGNNGHGTAVASLVGGNRVGVASNVTIVPLKITPCRYMSARAHHPAEHYEVGDLIWNATGAGNVDHYWTCISPGTSGPSLGWEPPASIPVGGTYGDNGITWQRVDEPPDPTYGSSTGVSSTAYIADALDWIQDPQRNTQNSRSNAIVTMSTYAKLDANPDLGALELAAARVIASGIPIVASANNQNADACATLPARMSRTNPIVSLRNKVITVGGTMIRNNPDYQTGLPVSESANDGMTTGLEPSYVSTQWTRDARWICGPGDSDKPCTSNPGSNGGPCVTLFAPAKNIPVASMKDVPTDYRDPRRIAATASGTSWSAPIVTGVLARILQRNQYSSVDALYNLLMAHTITGAIDSTDLHPAGVACDGTRCTDNVLLNYRDVVISTQPQDATNSGGGVTLSVTANRSDVSYQWFEVNSGFDLTRRTGASSSSALTGQTWSTLNVNPTSDKAYWVRVATSCSQTESNIAKVTVAAALPPPTAFTAMYNSGLISFAWNAVSGATSYRIERKLTGVDWAAAYVITGGSTTSSNQTAPSVPTGVVLYRILALNGSVASAPGPRDIAYVNALADDPIVAGSTFIKAEHLVSIRNATNALCDLIGAAPQYQPSELSLAGQTVGASHFTTTFDRLNVARQSAGLPQITWTVVTPQTGNTVTRTPIADLRAGIK